MKIREHPSIVVWPPQWQTSLDGDFPPVEQQEAPVLRKVELCAAQYNSDYHRHLRLHADYRRKNYVGILTILRDPEFLARLHEKLTGSLGWSIREIGDWDI
jgi:hypothetical protein